MITFKIDELPPCLKLVETGEIYDTEIIRIKRKSVLQKFNSGTGWHYNWAKFENDVEVYALVLKGTFDIQGLIAIKDVPKANGVRIEWACTAPENNPREYATPKFEGVGDQLLAFARNKSIELGHDGFIFAEEIVRVVQLLQ